MNSSYLVILDRRGVAELLEETEHAWRFLSRRCYRQEPFREALAWATLTPQDAGIIRSLARRGRYAEALRALEATAHQLGTIPPTEQAPRKNRPAA